MKTYIEEIDNEHASGHYMDADWLSNEYLPELSFKYNVGTMRKVKIKNSTDSYEFFKSIFDEDTIDYFESFVVVYLNRANITIGWVKISQGGLHGTVVDPKQIHSGALLAGACSMILAHNHPSKQTKPSTQDIELTTKLIKGGRFLDIKVLDHLIITSDNGYYSFKDENLI